MFKVLILQTQNSLSDERTEFYLRDRLTCRLTWMRFLGLGLGDPVPDANTIWTFREALTKAGAIERLFALFDRELRARGYLAMSGQLVDASIVAAPKQRNTKAEKQAIRRPGAGGLAGQTGDAQPEGSRCALDRQDDQSKAPRGGRRRWSTWRSPSSPTRTTSAPIADTG